MGESLSRRGFVQGAAVGTAGIAVAAGCGVWGSSRADADQAVKAVYTPGTYTASTRGNGGPVTVAVEVDDH